MKKLIPQGVRNIYHLFQAILANLIYGFPSKNLKVIGVTGTNGKTTTVQMIAKILEEAGFRMAVISTINFKIGEREWVNATKFTTLSSFKVQKFIKDAIEAGCQYLVLETSSHSLDQNRIWGIDFETAVITNVTREHLDYHKTMEEYRRVKMKLFEKAKTAVVNLDMEDPDDLLKFNNENKIGYSTNSKNNLRFKNYDLRMIFAENINLGINQSKFTINDKEFLTHMPGLFNIENALAAISVGISENINWKTIAKALEEIKGVPGRFEFVPNDKGFNIIIDYAVTPDSLEKLYVLIQNLKKAKPSGTEGFAFGPRVISVFGSCGERDRGKRPIMGEIICNNCNYAIVTNEDPYNEDPAQIINEICAGIKNKEERKTFWKILDRREAIKKALQIAKPGDYIVVTGKGAEETMAIGKERIPWNDRKVIREELAELV